MLGLHLNVHQSSFSLSFGGALRRGRFSGGACSAAAAGDRQASVQSEECVPQHPLPFLQCSRQPSQRPGKAITLLLKYHIADWNNCEVLALDGTSQDFSDCNYLINAPILLKKEKTKKSVHLYKLTAWLGYLRLV